MNMAFTHAYLHRFNCSNPPAKSGNLFSISKKKKSGVLARLDQWLEPWPED